MMRIFEFIFGQEKSSCASCNKLFAICRFWSFDQCAHRLQSRRHQFFRPSECTNIHISILSALKLSTISLERGLEDQCLSLKHESSMLQKYRFSSKVVMAGCLFLCLKKFCLLYLLLLLINVADLFASVSETDQCGLTISDLWDTSESISVNSKWSVLLLSVCVLFLRMEQRLEAPPTI